MTASIIHINKYNKTIVPLKSLDPLSIFLFITEVNQTGVNQKCFTFLSTLLLLKLDFDMYLDISPTTWTLRRMYRTFGRSFLISSSFPHFIRHSIHIIGKTTPGMANYGHPVYHLLYIQVKHTQAQHSLLITTTCITFPIIFGNPSTF